MVDYFCHFVSAVVLDIVGDRVLLIQAEQFTLLFGGCDVVVTFIYYVLRIITLQPIATLMFLFYNFVFVHCRPISENHVIGLFSSLRAVAI